MAVFIETAGEFHALSMLRTDVESASRIVRVLGGFALNEEDCCAVISPRGDSGDPLAGICVPFVGFEFGRLYDAKDCQSLGEVGGGVRVRAEFFEEVCDLMSESRRIDEFLESFDDRELRAALGDCFNDLAFRFMLFSEGRNEWDLRRRESHVFEGAMRGAFGAIGCDVYPGDGVRLQSENRESFFPIKQCTEEPAGLPGVTCSCEEMDFFGGENWIDEVTVGTYQLFTCKESEGGQVNEPPLTRFAKVRFGNGPVGRLASIVSQPSRDAAKSLRSGVPRLLRESQ